MKQRQGHELPTVPVGLNDLAALRSIISGYLVVLRRTSLRAVATTPNAGAFVGECLPTLDGYIVSGTGGAYLLERAGGGGIEYCAAGVCRLCALESSPSMERDETLQMLELLRQQLLTMLRE